MKLAKFGVVAGVCVLLAAANSQAAFSISMGVSPGVENVAPGGGGAFTYTVTFTGGVSGTPDWTSYGAVASADFLGVPADFASLSINGVLTTLPSSGPVLEDHPYTVVVDYTIKGTATVGDSAYVKLTVDALDPSPNPASASYDGHVVVSAVPEPSTVVAGLGALGMGLMALMRRK